jgi:hypothetical protein
MIFLCWDATNLEEKSDASPGKCGMDRIILGSIISNLPEKINPFNDLAKEVSEDNCLSTLPGISPSLIDAFLLGLFGKHLQV